MLLSALVQRERSAFMTQQESAWARGTLIDRSGWRSGGAQREAGYGFGGSLLGSFLMLAIAGWFLGRWPAKRWAASVAAVILIGVIAVSVLAPRKFAAASTSAATAESQTGWEPWTAEAVSRYQAQGRPVLVDFTASWCLSCQVNERVALDQPSVEKAFQDNNVALLKADWTRGDDAITQTLAVLGRSGVPAYALYVPGETSPRLLPEALTPGIVIDAVSKLPRPATQSVAATSNLK